MANHQLLFGRPLVADETLPPLSVTGALEGYTSGEAYDSELDINNSVGRCTLTVIESTLPPGARVFIDQLRKKVVVRWDAYTPPVETVQLVPNGDFEAGDDGRWSLGPGWTIGSGADYSVQDGTHSARFKDYKGTSDMVLASVPAKTNDYIKIDAMIQHGASSEGNVGARVSLVWRAEDGRELDRNWGNYISSGSKGAWKTSTAEGYGPGDAQYVSVVLSAKRSRQNHGLFVDKITWNHKYALGQNGDDLYFLRLLVLDSLNREAYWQGYIDETANVWISQLYPVHTREALSISSAIPIHFAVPEAPDLRPEEPLNVSPPTVTYFGIRDVYIQIAAPQESGGIGSAVATAFALREVTISTGSSEQAGISGPGATRFGIRPEPVFAVSTNGTIGAPVATRFSIG